MTTIKVLILLNRYPYSSIYVQNFMIQYPYWGYIQKSKLLLELSDLACSTDYHLIEHVKQHLSMNTFRRGSCILSDMYVTKLLLLNFIFMLCRPYCVSLPKIIFFDKMLLYGCAGVGKTSTCSRRRALCRTNT